MASPNTSQFDTALDTINYLASLVSNVSAIDPLLDPVRLVTSRSSTDGSSSGLSVLQEAQQKLEDYLVDSDPVRVFTRQELQQKIHAHLHSDHLRRWRIILWATLLAAFTMFGVAYLLPGGRDPVISGQTGAFLALLVLSGGAAWFFITALKNFRAELKPAYTLLCLSSVLLGLGQIQLPIVAYYDLGATPLFRYGGVGAPTCIAMICTYIAIRRYARGIGLSRSVFTQLSVIVPLITFFVAVMVGVGYVVRPQHDPLFDVSLSIMAINFSMVVCTSFVANEIARITTTMYKIAMRLLSLAQIIAAIGLGLFLTLLIVNGSLYGMILSIVALPFLLSSIMWLVASYAFKKAGEY